MVRSRMLTGVRKSMPSPEGNFMAYRCQSNWGSNSKMERNPPIWIDHPGKGLSRTTINHLRVNDFNVTSQILDVFFLRLSRPHSQRGRRAVHEVWEPARLSLLVMRLQSSRRKQISNMASRCWVIPDEILITAMCDGRHSIGLLFQPQSTLTRSISGPHNIHN